MRRPFAITFASLTLASLALGLTAPGCGNDALNVQDLCGWLSDECNCYRRFAAGVANMSVDPTTGTITGSPLCGVALDSSNNAVDATGATIADDASKPTYGTFSSRDKLDICVLLRPEGGQVVFDPAIDVTTLPLAAFSFKILDGSGQTCATGSYGSITNFSIGFPGAESTGTGGSGTGGAGGTGGTGGSEQLCRTGADASATDPSKDPISDGTFTMSPGDASQIVETSCPDGEAHRFNLYQLNKCDGSDPNENAYKALLPTAEIEADPGAANVDGYIRFRVFWPPTAAGLDLNGQKPTGVEYFHCLIPGASLPCFDKALSDGETDIDCGGVCPVKCDDGKDCLVGSDCGSKVCEKDAMGFLKCVSPPCGDLVVSGLETCDDGNTVSGDGCSSTCRKEDGYTCPNPGACVDIDECATMTDNCPAGTTCENKKGSFTCLCDPGFTFDGTQCVAGCGDSDLKAPEECDDGNTASGDGCTANCQKEDGYFCMGEGPGSCVDIDECATMTDTCLDTESCQNTTGSFSCNCDQTGTAVCNGVCIDVASDVFNCGACDTVCLPNQGCYSGVCCSAPNDAACNGTCTNTQTDGNNCGACGTVCGAGESCLTGKCCASPNDAVCNGACTDTQTDSNNCGACGTACTAPQTCQAGTCM